MSGFEGIHAWESDGLGMWNYDERNRLSLESVSAIYRAWKMRDKR